MAVRRIWTRVRLSEPRWRWTAAVLAGLVAYALVPAEHGPVVRAAAAWDAAMVMLLALAWWVILTSDPERTQRRSAAEDPGRVGLLGLSLGTSIVSFAAAVTLVSRPERYAPDESRGLVVALGLFTVLGAWVLSQTAFALHYARRYYADDGSVGGLDFAGGPPDDLDFAYFAFGIGMTFQVSDVVVVEREFRRLVLLHSILSFVFNTTILALLVNLIAGRL